MNQNLLVPLKSGQVGYHEIGKNCRPRKKVLLNPFLFSSFPRQLGQSRAQNPNPRRAPPLCRNRCVSPLGHGIERSAGGRHGGRGRSSSSAPSVRAVEAPRDVGREGTVPEGAGPAPPLRPAEEELDGDLHPRLRADEGRYTDES